jgi:hypothetical protein
MKTKYDLDRTKLLHDSPRLVQWAINKGLMSYPLSQKFLADGSPDPNIESTEYVHPDKYTPQFCRRAYDLRELGMTLNDLAKAIGVSRGSVPYILAKGHEAFLESERIKHNSKSE